MGVLRQDIAKRALDKR